MDQLTLPALKSFSVARKRLGMAINALAVKAGVSQSTIQYMDEADWNPTHATMKALSWALKKEDRRQTSAAQTEKKNHGRNRNRVASAAG